MVWNTKQARYVATVPLIEDNLPIRAKPPRKESHRVYSDREAVDIIVKVLETVNSLHAIKIVHKDIKPGNILVIKQNNTLSVTLCDFNSADEVADDGLIYDSQGTRAFSPPELFRSFKAVDGYARDVWSIGITLYCLLFGELPFKSSPQEELSLQVEIMRFKLDDGITPCRALLEQMLEPDPTKRASTSHALALAMRY